MFGIFSLGFILFVAVPSCADAVEPLLDPATYFSYSYKEARTKFLEATRIADADLTSYKHPLTGLDGEALYMDVASLGNPDAKTVLVLGSGTHGVEGFAGSAIQTGLLREGIGQLLSPTIRVAMIHGINPYGFSHLRRVNEDNVDINRNFVDHARPYPINKGYEDLAEVIAPRAISHWHNLLSRLSLAWYRVAHGQRALKVAISRGQYSHPDGLFFGGTAEAWSNRTLREALHNHAKNARRVVFVDFHTGLGEYGEAEIILNVGKKSSAYQRALQWWGARVKSTVTGESVSEHIYGPLKLAVPEMLPVADEVTAASLEFGTVPPMEVFWAMRAENWLQHYGGKAHPRAQEIKMRLLQVFYPHEEQWRRQVWEHGEDVVEQALIRLQ
jgi:hypothetical protein